MLASPAKACRKQRLGLGDDPFAPGEPVEAAGRNRRKAVERTGELAGDRAGGVGVVGEVHRVADRIVGVAGAPDAPQRRLERVCDIARGRVLSVLCEPVSTWQSPAYELTPSGGKLLPLRQGGGATFLECGAVDEVAFLGKMVVKRGMNRSEFLQ